MNIFEYDSYKKYLQDYIAANKQKGIISRLAQEAGCDRTYLSQTLNSKVQLTTDHAIRLAEALRLGESEQDFFLLLVLFERASDRDAKNKIKRRLQKMVAQNLAITKKIQEREVTSELTDAEKAQYYSSWLYGMVHILTSIPLYQNRKQLQNHLHLSNRELDFIVNTLVDMRLVNRCGDTFIHSGQNVYLPSGSPYIPINHLNWRTKAIEKSAAGHGIHYCLTFSLAKSDIEKLKLQLLEFVERQRNFIHKSGSEEVFCFCCDLFSP